MNGNMLWRFTFAAYPFLYRFIRPPRAAWTVGALFEDFAFILIRKGILGKPAFVARIFGRPVMDLPIAAPPCSVQAGFWSKSLR